jgi:immune inhibitor A
MSTVRRIAATTALAAAGILATTGFAYAGDYPGGSGDHRDPNHGKHHGDHRGGHHGHGHHKQSGHDQGGHHDVDKYHHFDDKGHGKHHKK